MSTDQVSYLASVCEFCKLYLSYLSQAVTILEQGVDTGDVSTVEAAMAIFDSRVIEFTDFFREVREEVFKSSLALEEENNG